MKNKEAQELLDRYLSGQCSPEEKILVERAYNLESSKNEHQISAQRYTALKTEIWDDLKQHQYLKRTHSLWPRIAAAASILIVFSISGYYMWGKIQYSNPLIIRTKSVDITPGSNGATLTLANGKKIILKSVLKGQVAVQGNMSVLKTNDGEIKYETIDGEENLSAINTISTKRKEQYQVVLSDGTKVWLNAASSIRYPVAFTGNNREVEITGEAYFEVAHNATKPFRVLSKGQTVEVLGTHFNINSYDDEVYVTTTLLQGSIKVIQNVGGISKNLSPGQQSIFFNKGIKLSAADTEQAVAWKNGDFQFENDIKSIMRQLARWYDVDVSYKGIITDEEFVASIPRSKNINEVLKALQLTKKVHFKIEGRSIIVMP